jgi:hypothetical protein
MKGLVMDVKKVTLLGTLPEALVRAGVVPPPKVIGNLEDLVSQVAVDAHIESHSRRGYVFLDMSFLVKAEMGPGHVITAQVDCHFDPSQPQFGIDWECFANGGESFLLKPRLKGPLSLERDLDPEALYCLKSILLGVPADTVELLLQSRLKLAGESVDRVVSCPVERLKLFGISQPALCRWSELKADAFSLGNAAAQDLDRQWAEPVGDRPPSLG